MRICSPDLRLCSWAGAAALLASLVLLTLLSSSAASEDQQRTRHYYIAAVPIQWDYSEGHGHGRAGPSYKKLVFREYEEGFRQAKTHPPWLGLLGPTLRGQVGDTIVVTFKNMADRPLTMHPHGIAYGKQSEGALYFDNTSRQEKEDDVVPPGGQHTYYWELNRRVAPQRDDPQCLTYTYQSHFDVVKDYNSGLIGALLVCKPGSLNETGNWKQLHFHHEYVLMFGVFDERHSWYKPASGAAHSPVKHTINGYTHGAVPGLSVCAHTSVALHLVGMSSEPEVFSVHVNGQILEHHGHRVASVGVISGTATSAQMTAFYPGRWLLSSQTTKHLEAGMHGFVDVVSCEGIPTPHRRLTIQQTRQMKQWTFFIAAEEMVWDYAPNMPDYLDGDFKTKYLDRGPNRIGQKYKKVVYTQYTDATFTTREQQRKIGIIGPVIRAQIRDVIKIVFQNKASRPYSIYPHGLTIDKDAEGVNYPDGGNQTHGVQPGETHTYVWRVIEDDEPLDSDSRCLTHMYHSAVNTPRDIASGLVGPLLICKSQSLNTRNVQLKADKEQHAMFAIFDENKSWYLDDNIREYSERDRCKKDDPDFYQSNVMHTVNGYVFDSGQVLGFCNGDIVTWHVSSVGAHNHIQTVTFYGHVFGLHDRTEDFLSLYPMSGATITMNMDNIGVWLMASLNSHETTKGMRVKFRDVECFSHYEYEYEVSVWKPEDMAKLTQPRPTDPPRQTKSNAGVDLDTLAYADLLGLRAFNGTGESDMEKLDLSFLDEDVVGGETDDGVIQTLLSPIPPSLLSDSSSTLPSSIPPSAINVSSSTLPSSIPPSTINNSSSTLPSSISPSLINDSSSTLPSSIPPSTTNDSSSTLSTSIPPSLLNDSSSTLPSSIPPSPLNDSSSTLPSSIPPSLLNDSSSTLPSSISPSPINDSSSSLPSSIPPSLLNDSSSTLPSSIPPSLLNDSSSTLPSSISPSTINNSSSTLPSSIPPSTINNCSSTLSTSISPSTINDSSSTLHASIPPSFLNDSSSTLPSSISPSTTNDSSSTLSTSIPPSPLNDTHNGEMEEKKKNSTVPPPGSSPDSSLNHTLLANRSMIDIRNLTAEVSWYEGVGENRSETLDQSAGQSGGFVAETGNRTVQNISLLRGGGDGNTGAGENVSSEARAETRAQAQRGPPLANLTLDSDASEEKITRGDVFFHDSGEKDLFINDTSLTTDSPSEDGSALTGNTTGQLDLSENATNQSEPVSVSELDLIKQVERNMSSFNQEVKGVNLTNGNQLLDTVTTVEYGNGSILSEVSSIADNSSLKHQPNNRTSPRMIPTQNVTTNASSWNQQKPVSSENTESVSNETASPSTGNLSLTANQERDSRSEEVVIYLQDSDREAIRTTSRSSKDPHWGYNATHHTVPMEMPDHMTKYTGKGPAEPEEPSPGPTQTPTPTPTPTPEPIPEPTRRPTKKVLRKHWPQQGRAIKTRKNRTYKPQKPSRISPRGFNPSFSPQGLRPIPKTEEDLLNKPIVIGVPRADFSDYEIYIPGDYKEEVLPKSAVDSGSEYEYISYKDPYSLKDFPDLGLDENAKYFLKTAGKNVRIYFLTAEEVEWDYAGYGKRVDKLPNTNQHTQFTKVMFRGYVDRTFRVPDIRGEMEEHLGILGPVIKAEVGESIMVLFRNLAKRPFSLHPNGVSYTKHTEGLSYKDESDYWFQYDNEVQPNTTFTYIWNVNSDTGPMDHESDCRTWAYYSGVNPEKDIHSGLIGPLLVCRPGTLDRKRTDLQVFTLLFMTFDESQSWYYDRNRERIEKKNRRAALDPDFRENLKFHSINGILFGLKGLRMYSDQLVRWHLINMGPPQDLHSVHFHGQTFLQQHTHNRRQGVYPLLPGGLATLEMVPSRPGLWQVETEVGLYQQRGMQTLMLVLDKNCSHPLGLESRSVTDRQITASSFRGYWEPSLARLHNQGKYNAWSTDQEKNSWIQVDFQRPVVISQVSIQGAKEMLRSQYVTNYTISYSTDRRRWTYYKGDDSTHRMMNFPGNDEAHKVQTNTFFPPLIGRFVRLHPLSYYNKPTVRMDFYGCQLDGCSVPLGMETGQIEDHRITSSSTSSSWYSGKWHSYLARLNNQGTINAWQANYNSADQWLQVELAQVKKITGIVTQGAKALGKEKFVTSYALQSSQDGKFWTSYTDDEDYPSKIFPGNTDNNGHVKNYIYPPIFSRFIRVIPLSWQSSITMRVELLGCDFE